MKNRPTESEDFFQKIQIEFLIHELKTPVSVVETGLRTLLEKREKYGDLSSRQEKTLKRALRNTQKTREMLHHLLEVGRSGSGCLSCALFRPGKVAYDVLMEALESMSGGIYEQCRRCRGEEETIHFLTGCGIFLSVPPLLNDTEMFQDQTKFRQILGNLIKNALHHRRGRVEVIMRQAEDQLMTDVSDDGCGIDPAHHQLIFQRYAQVGKECVALQRMGHGLGLAGARILARGLGGDIEVKSRKGEGAIFRLTLPMKNDA